MIILNFNEIKEKVRNNELRSALTELLIISDSLKRYQGYKHANTVENILGQYNSNLRNDRNGIIRREDFITTENRIRHSILETIDEIENIPEIKSILRMNRKRMIVARENYERKYIEIDYSRITNGEINNIKLPLIDYVDFGDLVNGIYICMSDYTSPFSYDKEWILTNEKGTNIIKDVIEKAKLKRSFFKKIKNMFNQNNEDIYHLSLDKIQNFGIFPGDKFIIEPL